MAGYIGTQAVSVNTTSATISDDLAVGDDATVAGDATVTGVITGSTVEATGDTAAGDNAAMGYTSAEGLILTGQGSTNDVTIKNDADADVIEIPTGTVNVTMAGTLGVAGVVTANAGVVVDNITIDGQEIDVSSGDLTLDVAGDIYLNADGGQVYIKDGSTNIATFENSANALLLTDGNLKIGTAGHGIDFHNFGSGATIGSNLLDDYEEGVWTPAIKHGSTAATMTDLGASGSYTKVGRMVTLMGNAKVAGVNGNGAVTMTGFPFTVADTVAVTGVEASGTISYYASWGAVVNSLVITASAGNTTGEMYGNHNTSGMNSTAEAITQVELNANAEFRFSITYFST